MPVTVSELMCSAGITQGGVVPWRSPVPSRSPGVYVVALQAEIDDVSTALDEAPIDTSAIAELISVRPELTVDGRQPSPAQLADRISRFWLPGETVVYVGQTKATLASRVNAYYSTPLGARRPHAGGWFIKTLRPDVPLWVHWAASAAPIHAEDEMLKSFCAAVPASVKTRLLDPLHPFPFANLEWPPGIRKAHGIRGARAPK